MANKSKLIKHAIDTYKIAPLSSWILGITTGIIITALLALDLVVPFMGVLIYPLMVLPIIFSASIQHTLFKTNGQLSFSSSIKSFGLYFTFPFRGSFRFFSSLLKSILVFLISEFLLSFIISTVLQYTSASFVESINNLYALLNSEGASLNDVNAALYANGGVLFNYACSVLFPPYFLAILFLIYNNSRNSIMIYYQLTHPRINPRAVRYIYFDTVRGWRMQMLGDYLMLNWPLYVLLAIGFGGGATLGYFWQKDLLGMIATGVGVGSLLGTFYLPFYFCNQEALFDAYADRLEGSTKRVTEFMLASLQQNIDISIDEKKKIEESLLNKEDENDNKKDSDEP